MGLDGNMEILKFPHPMLLKPCKSVSSFGVELKVILDEMYETMLKSNGVGLAANQVNIDLQAFVMITEVGNRLNVINPQIVWQSEEKSKFKEGCLSTPGTFLHTGYRSERIIGIFQNERGNSIRLALKGRDAVCFAHERQHVTEGKAFFQSENIPRDKRKVLCKKWGLKP